MNQRVAIFSSGSGSNAENIIQYFLTKKSLEFPLIISNKQDAFVHARARKFGLPSFTFTKDEFCKGTTILALLQKYDIGHIVLAGFLLKVSEPLLHAFPNKIINIHPALLPKFGGKGMYGNFVHQAVVDAREAESGITIHYVNEHYDDGNIIFQATCPVLPSDTPEMVADKVHALEYEHFPKVIERLLAD